MRRKFNTIPKVHIKKGDTVKVLSGDDKGKTGRVITVLPKDSRAVVEGVNIITKHSKPSAANPEGGRIQKEASIHISNLAVIDSKSISAKNSVAKEKKQKSTSKTKKEEAN
jgi:large subunit ribosomal protein L24